MVRMHTPERESSSPFPWTVDDLCMATYNVVFSVLDRAEGYDNVQSILSELAVHHSVDGEAEARRLGWSSFEAFITSGIMEQAYHHYGLAGGLLQIERRDGRALFFRALAQPGNRRHYGNLVDIRKIREKRRARLSGLTQSCGDFPRKHQEIDRIVLNYNIPSSWRLCRPQRLDVYRPRLAPRSASAPATSRTPVPDLGASSCAGIHPLIEIVWYEPPRHGRGRGHRRSRD